MAGIAATRPAAEAMAPAAEPAVCVMLVSSTLSFVPRALKKAKPRTALTMEAPKVQADLQADVDVGAADDAAHEAAGGDGAEGELLFAGRWRVHHVARRFARGRGLGSRGGVVVGEIALRHRREAYHASNGSVNGRLLSGVRTVRQLVPAEGSRSRRSGRLLKNARVLQQPAPCPCPCPCPCPRISGPQFVMSATSIETTCSSCRSVVCITGSGASRRRAVISIQATVSIAERRAFRAAHEPRAGPKLGSARARRSAGKGKGRGTGKGAGCFFSSLLASRQVEPADRARNRRAG